LLRNLKMREHLGDFGGKCKSQCLKEIGWGDWIVFVSLMIRVSGGFFYILLSPTLYRQFVGILIQ